MDHNHNRESSTINKIPNHMAYSFLLTGNTLIIYSIKQQQQQQNLNMFHQTQQKNSSIHPSTKALGLGTRMLKKTE
jgi:hypothetical protein